VAQCLLSDTRDTVPAVEFHLFSKRIPGSHQGSADYQQMPVLGAVVRGMKFLGAPVLSLAASFMNLWHYLNAS